MTKSIQETLATLALDLGMTHKSSPSQTLEIITALLIKRVAELERKDENKIRIALNKKLSVLLEDKSKDDLIAIAPSYYSSAAIENFNKLIGREENNSTEQPISSKPTTNSTPIDTTDYTRLKNNKTLSFSIGVNGKQYKITSVYSCNSNLLDYKICYNKQHLHIENVLDSDIELFITHPTLGKVTKPVNDLSWISMYIV